MKRRPPCLHKGFLMLELAFVATVIPNPCKRKQLLYTVLVFQDCWILRELHLWCQSLKCFVSKDFRFSGNLVLSSFWKKCLTTRFDFAKVDPYINSESDTIYHLPQSAHQPHWAITAALHF